MSLLELSVLARMNFSAAKKALGFLISKRLVDWTTIDSQTRYYPNERGKEFISNFKAILVLMT